MARGIPRLLVSALLSGALALSPGCGKRGEVFRISVILPLTGPEARTAREHLNGIVLGVEELNAAGTGVTYEIVTDNDDGKPAAAREAFKRALVDKKINVAFVVTRTSAMAIAGDADREFVPLFANVSHPLMAIMHFYVFRNYPSSGLEIKRMTAFASRFLKLQSIAVLTSGDERGSDAVSTIEEECRANGIAVAAKAAFDGAAPEPAAASVLAARPAAIYVFGGGEAAASAIGALRAARYDGIILGPSDLPRTLAANRSNAALEGVYCPMNVFERSGNAAFEEAYRTRFNTSPTVNAAVEYDAVGILATAVEIMNREKLSVQNALKRVGSVRGVLGDYEYTDREWLPPLSIVQIKGGAAAPL